MNYFSLLASSLAMEKVKVIIPILITTKNLTAIQLATRMCMNRDGIDLTWN
jgi:hypothetical protein